MFLRFTNLDFFSLHILLREWVNMMLLIHNSEYWIKEYLKPFSASALFTLFHTPISNIILSGKFQVGAGGKRAYFYTTPPLSTGQVSKCGRYSWESRVWNLYSFSFFEDLCFCPIRRVVKSLRFRKVVKSLRFGMWMNKF